MKLVVAIAVMDAVDRGEWRLADRDMISSSRFVDPDGHVP
jgi:hypothetical protein